ncbi:hypothetical protein IMCC1989_1057 [gamma proteobacterium IMCC1989]|nr:hypothetical protein IMCC1989_1057 [gamma proteobacterium IMCC1989]
MVQLMAKQGISLQLFRCGVPLSEIGLSVSLAFLIWRF